MTKSEFDELFLSGECCVLAATMEQWFAVNEYARSQFGLGRSSAYFEHDCGVYPFVVCNSGIVDAIIEEHDRMVISFAEFSKAIRKEEDEEEIPSITLDGVL